MTTTTKRPGKRFVASICAVVAAAAMVTGIAVFSASATTVKNASTADKLGTVVTTVADSKADTAAQTKTEDKVNENGKHPGECGYGYVAEPQMKMVGFNAEAVKADSELDDEAWAVKHEGEAGYNYVNENGKHPGECGYGYAE